MTTKATDTATKATDTPTYYATRDFKDAGTERTFERGAVLEIDKGTARNYVAAGVASTEKPTAEKAAAEKPVTDKATA